MNANGLYNGLDAGAAMGVYNGTNVGARAGLVGNEQNAKLRLLDRYPGAAAAYSLRKLSFRYTGPCIRVRRDSDNAEIDVGFDGNGNVNLATLSSFVGANSGFITVWYDQSGNSGRDSIQTITANQPRIVNLGVVERENNNTCLRWVNGNSQHLVVNQSNLNISQPISTFSVSKLTAASGINASVLFDNNSATNNPFRFYATGNTDAPNNTFILYTNNIGLLTGCGAQNANQNLFTTISQTATTPNNEVRLNGTEVDNNSGTVVNPLNGLTIGNVRPGAGAGTLAIYDWSGWIFELIFYPSDQALNRLAIETNINNYYKIY
jgi:hypothetical protein